MHCMEEQHERQKVGAYLRRVCDLTSPTLPRFDESRCDCRQNRTIPVLLTPWEDGHAIVAESVTALSKDVSNRGLSVTLPSPFQAAEVVVGIWLPDAFDAQEPRFILGATRQNVPIGGGFWALGIEASHLIFNGDTAALLSVAKSRLQVPQCQSMLLPTM
jgi:hypothetical protein